MASLQREVKDFEPAAALDGGEDGLDFYRRLAEEAPSRLRAGGVLLCECGKGQSSAVAALFAGFANVRVMNDYEGADRIAVFQGEKRPDERYLVRFRQNEDGEYEADGHPMWMYGPYPVRGVYSQALDGDGEVCFAVWNESETLAEVRLQVNDAPEAEVPIPAPPSLTIWRLQVAGTEWRLEDRYFDTAGNMLP